MALPCVHFSVYLFASALWLTGNMSRMKPTSRSVSAGIGPSPSATFKDKQVKLIHGLYTLPKQLHYKKSSECSMYPYITTLSVFLSLCISVLSNQNTPQRQSLGATWYLTNPNNYETVWGNAERTTSDLKSLIINLKNTSSVTAAVVQQRLWYYTSQINYLCRRHQSSHVQFLVAASCSQLMIGGHWEKSTTSQCFKTEVIQTSLHLYLTF